jgi:hypothetical protein
MIAIIKKFLPALILSAETTILSLFYCCTSPLAYQLSPDTGASVLMGRIVMNGQIPFIDSYDAKGPIWWYFCALGQFFSTDVYYGFYPLTLVIYLVSAYLLYRITKIFLSPALSLVTTSLGSLAWLIAKFDAGLFTPEILMIPIGLYLALLGVKIVLKLNHHLNWYHLGAGILAAIMFWSKYNYAATFVGFYLSLIIIWFIQRNWANLRQIGWTILGFLVVTGPLLVFYWANHGLTELYQGYFVENLTYRLNSPTGIRNKIYHLYNLVNRSFSYHYFEVAIIVLASIIILIGMRQRLRCPGIWIAISTVLFTTIGDFFATSWAYQFTPFLSLVALATAYLSKQIISEIHSRRALCLASVSVFALFFVQTYASNLSYTSTDPRSSLQTSINSINSYTPNPSIITLAQWSNGWALNISLIAQSRAIPSGKYWVGALNWDQQLQHINDVIDQAGDLLLLRPMDTGQNCSFFDASTNQSFEVRIPDYVLNYYLIRSADTYGDDSIVLLEKRSQPLDPNFELNV